MLLLLASLVKCYLHCNLNFKESCHWHCLITLTYNSNTNYKKQVTLQKSALVQFRTGPMTDGIKHTVACTARWCVRLFALFRQALARCETALAPYRAAESESETQTQTLTLRVRVTESPTSESDSVSESDSETESESETETESESESLRLSNCQNKRQNAEKVADKTLI